MGLNLINITSDNIVIDDITLTAGSNDVSVTDFIGISCDPEFLNQVIQSNIQIKFGGQTLKYPESIAKIIDISSVIKNSFIPNKKGLTVIRKSGSVSTQQNATAIWTPASGKRFVITDFIVSVHNNTLGAQSIQVYDGSNSNGNHVINDVNASGSNYVIQSPSNTPFVSAARDNVLRVTTSGAIRLGYSMRGYETY